MSEPRASIQGADAPLLFEVGANVSNHFSWLRTRMSAERTLMSWMRTAVSLIGFGFTIVQFFERFRTMDGVDAPHLVDGPRYLGLALMFAGIVALFVSLWQYRDLIRYLRSADYAPIAGIRGTYRATATLSAALVLTAIGIFAFIAVLTRLV